jgi:hypothetical protein
VAAIQINHHYSHYREPFPHNTPSHLPASVRDLPGPTGELHKSSPRSSLWSDRSDGPSVNHFMSDRAGEQAYHKSALPAVNDERTDKSDSHVLERESTKPLSAAIPPAQGDFRQQNRHARSVELPPLPHALGAISGGFSPASRSAGVASILNPINSEDAGFDQRRRKYPKLDSPAASTSLLPPPAIADQSQRSVTSGANGPLPSMSSTPNDRNPRRILTPRSPSMHRAASLGQLPPSVVTNFGAQQGPLPGSPQGRTYSVEPGVAGVPPMPTPSAAMRQSYGLHTHVSPVLYGQDSIGASGAASGSTSPTSSYSQAGHGSPPLNYASGPSSAGAHASRSDPMYAPRSASFSVVGSGSSAAYQMMTIPTSSGPVQLPVDVQAASRVADDKRKRNAGASARFRQRRKEKEKEASTTIANLEQRLKEATEDCDFYIQERNVMAAALIQAPGGDRLFPRPHSPRTLRRNPNLSAAGSSSHLPSSDAVGERGNADEGRNVRRRISIATLPAPQAQTPHLPAQVPGPSHHHRSFAPHGYGQPHPTLAPVSLPHLHASTIATAEGSVSGETDATLGAGPAPPSLGGRGLLPAPQPSSHLLQAPPQPGPWNPYASDRRSVSGPGPARDSR